MKTYKWMLLAVAGAGLALAGRAKDAPVFPSQVERDFVITNFQFHSGQALPELRMHYLTLGKAERDGNGVVRNAVLILHGTTGSCGQFLGPEFAGELFGKGQPLDVSRYFVIIPDSIGHGRSSKPSDGLRAKFPNYGYVDMVEAQYRLVTEGLGVNHLRLVMGTSMGGMHTWLWGEKHPDFMDALMPLASLPTQISGRNRIWRRMIMDSIRNSPDWQEGNYQSQPAGLRVAAETLYFMGENPAMRMAEGPTVKQEDEKLDHYVATAMTRLDANDVLYALAASTDYDPAPELNKIKATLLAVNSADDLINPPELGVLERGIKEVKHGQAMVIPYSDQTVGHGSHTKAVLWKKDLADLLNRTEQK
jgi:homoserine O-acetyltransferase